MPEVTDPNCPNWATVDFGKGPVDIRCTQTGPHPVEKCMTVVFFVVPGEDVDVESKTQALEEAAQKEFPPGPDGHGASEIDAEVKDFPDPKQN